MSLIEEKSNNSNVSRYYHVENVSNISDAVEWICSVIKSKTVDPMYISLSDLVNRSDEGSGNTQLDAKATYDDIMHELDDKNIDIISVIGRFQEKPVVIGVDLRNTQCFLTARKSKKFDFEAIENKLNLSENGLTLFGIQKRPGRNNTSSQSAAAMQPSKSPKPAIAQVACYCGTGRRNASLAVVRVYKKGTGSIIINGLDINDYFGHETLKSIVRQPLNTTGVIDKVNIDCTVKGGDFIGQASAIRQGVSRALRDISPEYRKKLKSAGLLTNDLKMKERNKYGLKTERRLSKVKK
jgi:Ribosomal protein S9